MEQSLFTSILFATIVAGTPLVITALGELVTEKSGVLNLGAEGIMSVGAIVAFAVTHHSHNAFLGVLAGLGAGMGMSLIFAYLTLTLMANQVAAGLALSIFGVGLSAFIGKPYESVALASAVPVRIPLLADIPYLGPALFHQQALVYFSWVMLALVAWFLYRTRPGLTLRAVGESPVSAHDIGHPVIGIRYTATLFGGAMAGIGGAFMSVFYTPMWVEGMIAGRGWISLALVVFATWRPMRVMVGAYLFGGAMISQMFVQGSGWQISIPAQFLSSIPYAATILVLVLISRNLKTIRLNSPASLGQPFLPDA
jgi:general nucleoside transport system permease protein